MLCTLWVDTSISFLHQFFPIPRRMIHKFVYKLREFLLRLQLMIDNAVYFHFNLRLMHRIRITLRGKWLGRPLSILWSLWNHTAHDIVSTQRGDSFFSSLFEVSRGNARFARDRLWSFLAFLRICISKSSQTQTQKCDVFITGIEESKKKHFLKYLNKMIIF